MPQASDASRKRYRQSFPDIGAEHAVTELKLRGFRLGQDWCWTAPPDHTPDDEELFWIGFLVDEWDFGGLA